MISRRRALQSRNAPRQRRSVSAADPARPHLEIGGAPELGGAGRGVRRNRWLRGASVCRRRCVGRSRQSRTDDPGRSLDARARRPIGGSDRRPRPAARKRGRGAGGGRLDGRARLRRDSAVGDVERLSAELRDYGRQRIARERQLDRLLGSAVTLHPAGFAIIDSLALEHAEAELGDRLLGRVALCIGGAAYPLRRERVSYLRAALLECAQRARTLGGSRFIPCRARLLVIRELSRAAPPVRLIPGTELFWDRRFGVTAPPHGASKPMLGYLGQSGMRRVVDRDDGGLPRLAHPVLPALWDETGLIAVPHLGYFRAGAPVLPRIAFHPVNRLSHAGFTVV